MGGKGREGKGRFDQKWKKGGGGPGPKGNSNQLFCPIGYIYFNFPKVVTILNLTGRVKSSGIDLL